MNTIVIRNLLENLGIQEVLDFDGLTEIAVNQTGRLFFDCGDGWEFIDNDKLNQQNLIQLANAMAVYSSVNLTADFPIASVVLPDGQRGQIIIPPATEDGNVSITIRTPSRSRFRLADYERSGRLSNVLIVDNKSKAIDSVNSQLETLKNANDIAGFLQLAVKSKKNILLVGGTGSGKTTVMKALVDIYPANKRMITIEDVHELDLPQHPNHLHLFYKNSGRLTPKLVIESCMRMKPDHIFLAELRGDEAWSYLEALNTGHSGSITTIHANDCRSAYTRLANLVKQSEVGQTLDYEYILETVKSSIDVVCYFEKTRLKELLFNIN